MNKVRFGIVGMGGIGLHHAKYLNTIDGAVLTAVCSRDPARRAAAVAQFPAVNAFATQTDMLQAGGWGGLDAVIICTPHYQHAPQVLEALAAGVHVLVEKPLAVTVGTARETIAAAQHYPKQVFGIMLNQRANPLHRWLRDQVKSGTLGELQRISWTATHWFRPNSYYTSSPWRATWAGEGGGLIVNQLHHNLDLLNWITGLFPRRITAVGFLGKRHPIETEDEVSAILEYDSGAIAHFYAATGEFPGVNRLELAGTRARLVVEDDKVTLIRGAIDSRDFIRTSNEPFGAPAKQVEAAPALPPAPTPEHKGIVEDFVRVIRAGLPSTALLAPASDDVAAVELGNALLLAAITRQPVDLPIAAAVVEAFLAERTRT